MAQRLVRLLCPHCKNSYEAFEEEWGIIQAALPQARQDTKPILYKARGCKFCNHIGYSGRSGIFEIMPLTNKMKELVMRNTSIHAVKSLARQEGMVTLWESGVKKVLKGLVSLEELMRVARPDVEEEISEEYVATGRVAGGLAEAAPKLAEIEIT
jgi:type II secretory ATPase GspE/PulE/Tfp pilus assembly ATPase PilB-like protein